MGDSGCTIYFRARVFTLFLAGALPSCRRHLARAEIGEQVFQRKARIHIAVDPDRAMVLFVDIAQQQ